MDAVPEGGRVGRLGEPARIAPGVDVEPGVEDRQLAALADIPEVEGLVDHERARDRSSAQRTLHGDRGLDPHADLIHAHLVLLKCLDDDERQTGGVGGREFPKPANVNLLVLTDHREDDAVEVAGVSLRGSGDGLDLLDEIEAARLLADGHEDGVALGLRHELDDRLRVVGDREEPGAGFGLDLHRGVGLLRALPLQGSALALSEPLGQDVEHAGHADARLVLERPQSDTVALGSQEGVDGLRTLGGDGLDLGDLGHVFAERSIVAVQEDSLLFIVRAPEGRGEAKLLLNSSQASGDSDETCGTTGHASFLPCLGTTGDNNTFSLPCQGKLPNPSSKTKGVDNKGLEEYNTWL